MRKILFIMLLAISVIATAEQLGLGHAVAASGGIPGKPDGGNNGGNNGNNKWVETGPPGIQKQIANGKTAHGRWSYLNPSKVIITTTTTTDVSSSENEAATVCSSALDEEALRLCLGQPAPVKKAVRVKKLNVQLGEAQ